MVENTFMVHYWSWTFGKNSPPTITIYNTNTWLSSAFTIVIFNPVLTPSARKSWQKNEFIYATHYPNIFFSKCNATVLLNLFFLNTVASINIFSILKPVILNSFALEGYLQTLPTKLTSSCWLIIIFICFPLTNFIIYDLFLPVFEKRLKQSNMKTS